MNDIFNYSNHFSYLKTRLSGALRWGGKTKFATFIGVQPPFLSQVLSEKYSLSLEQADRANQFFDHSKDESEFFLLLVSRDRAGTVSLRKHFEDQISQVLQKRKLVIERLGKKHEISEQSQSIYYTSWLYSAVHVACTIPNLRTRKALAARFQIPVELAGKILDFLRENELVEKRMEEYYPTQNWLRLGLQSPHIIKHHTNWRNQAIQNLEVQTEDDLHYSGIFSMDHKTARHIKDELLDAIKRQNLKIEKAPEEDLYIFGVDFFRKK